MTGTYKTEICIIGGGPAGLAAALALRQNGFDVIVADAAQPPIDKTCGEGIMPDGIAALHDLGVHLDHRHGSSFGGIRFLNDSQQVEASFKHGFGLGIRRTVLHQQLVNAADRRGARLLWGRRLTGILNDRVLLDRETVQCRWIVGADGQQSRTRYYAGLQPKSPGKVRFGVRRHFRVAPWSEYVEVHWSNAGQMYVTPVGDDEVCVAFISSHRVPFEEALVHFAALRERLRNASTEERARGAMTSSLRLHRVHHGNVALIGEAAGSVDAITGEGMAISFRQAGALAAAIRADSLDRYENAHRRIMRLPRAMAALMLSMNGRARFRERVFQSFQAQPEIFAHMLAVHTGCVTPATFAMRNGVSLGWQLLKAGV